MHFTSDEHCSDSTIVIKLKDAKLKKKAKMNIMTGFYVFSLSCYLGYEGDILKGRLYIFTLYAEYDKIYGYVPIATSCTIHLNLGSLID